MPTSLPVCAPMSSSIGLLPDPRRCGMIIANSRRAWWNVHRKNGSSPIHAIFAWLFPPDPTASSSGNRRYEEIRDELKITDNSFKLIVAVVEDGTAADAAGFQQGDTIRTINNNELENMSDFYAVINEPDNSESTFHIIPNGVEMNIGLPR